MNDSAKKSMADQKLPTAIVKTRKWNLRVVWIVPIVAAVIAGYLVIDRVEAFGPKIAIQFKDASRLKIGQTPIKYRGVTIGEVTAVRLSDDRQHVLVSARLQRSATAMARDGSVFWIVRPELSVGNITGLGTFVTGPEIQVLPGNGKPVTEFVGVENAPVGLEADGLEIILRSNQVGSLRFHSPVYYRGVEVGAVQDLQLSPNATAVDIHVYILQRYAKLVRSGSQFWNVSGAHVSGGLFRGVHVKVDSLSSLVAGGIAFATPHEGDVKPVPNGTVFWLYPDPKKEWLIWAPQIPLTTEK